MRSFFQEGEKRNVDHFHKYLHKDFRHNMYPRSIGVQEQTKEEWIKSFGEFTSLWAEDGKMTFHSVTEVPGKVIVHTSGKAPSSIGTEVIFEMVVTAEIVTDDDGSLKVKRIDEFTDSKAYLDFFKAVEAAKAREHSASFAA